MECRFDRSGPAGSTPLPEGRWKPTADRIKEEGIVALVVLLLVLAIFGGLGFAAHFLWWVLIAAVVLWVLGFFVGGVEAAGRGRRRWYGRW